MTLNGDIRKNTEEISKLKLRQTILIMLVIGDIAASTGIPLFMMFAV